MSTSLKVSWLALAFLVVSLDAMHTTNSQMTSEFEDLKQQVKKLDSVIELLQNYIEKQEEQEQEQHLRITQQEHLITTLHKKGRRHEKRLTQQENMITALLEQGQRQDKRLKQQENMITTLLEQEQRQEKRLTQQENMITTLLEQGQRQEKRLTQQENMITTLHEQGRRQESRLAQQELITREMQRQVELIIRTRKVYHTTSHGDTNSPLHIHEKMDNLTNIGEEISMLKSSTNGSNPFYDISRRVPISHTKRTTEGPIAFEVKSTKGVKHLGLKQAILFDQIVINLSNVYNSLHGTFTAPRSGMYIFSTSILAAGDVEVQILKNGQYIAGAIAQSITENNQGSVTVVAMLEPGDEVWVANTWPKDATVLGKGYTSFMGCLVEEF